jgi:hypothetical protein
VPPSACTCKCTRSRDKSDVGPVAGDQTLHGDGDEVCGDRTESQALITRDPVPGRCNVGPRDEAHDARAGDHKELSTNTVTVYCDYL